MNNYRLLPILFVLFTFLFSCSGGSNDDDDILGSTEYLNVTNVVSLPGDGSTSATLDIKADCSWSITGDPSWLSLSEKSGNGNASVILTATPNPSSTDERSAALTVSSSSGKIKRNVTVSQAISAETLSLSADAISFNSDGESKVLSIISNTAWRITGVEDWFTLSREEGNGNTDITITVSRNQSENIRQSTLTVQGSRTSQRVVINQAGRSTTLSINPTVINASALSGTYELQIDGDATWSASSNTSWAILSKTTGSGNATISVTVIDNTSLEPREAVLTFTTSQHSYTCAIKQEAGTTPTVSTTTISNIQRYSVTASSSYQSEFPIVDCGFCYSDTNSAPTVADNCVKCTDTTQANFNATIEKLLSGHSYYIRAYAKSSAGISYGPTIQTTTSGDVPGSSDNPTPEV